MPKEGLPSSGGAESDSRDYARYEETLDIIQHLTENGEIPSDWQPVLEEELIDGLAENQARSRHRTL